MKSKKKQHTKNTVPIIVIFILIIMFILPIPYYVEGPGTTENLNKFVTVDNKKDNETGGFYLTTVSVKQATIFSALQTKIDNFSELVTKKELMGSSSSKEYNQIQKYYMDSSKNSAIEQALKLAAIPYEMIFKGIYVLSVEENSSFYGQLTVGDIITGIDGQTFTSSEGFINYVKSKKIGQKVTIQFSHDGKEKEATGALMELPSNKEPGIGITLVDHTKIDTDKQIDIDAGSIGGPSAGLMFTLETYELLTGKNLRKGYEIAGTGTIESDGTVGRIGGIDKKVVTASNKNMDIFFAPDDEITEEMKKNNPNIQSNYEEAKLAAKNIGTKMKIIPVKKVQDAVEYLNKLEEKVS